MKSSMKSSRMKSSWQLRKYFAREVLGKDIGRKPPQREKRGQERNAAYLAWIGNRRSTPETLGGQKDHSTECWTSRRQEDR